MNYLSVIDHRTNKRLAFLDKAYNIGYRLEKNALWSASFSLPLDDPKNSHCKYFNFVEIYDKDKYIGLFRIMQSSTSKSSGVREAVYECEHVLATLMDDVLIGWHEIGNVGVYTTEVIRYVLSKQTVSRWQLKDCDFNRQFLYGWENENLLSALFSVPNAFNEDFRWEYDTSGETWTISLKKVSTKATAEIRYKKNMLGIRKTVDPTNLTTRLYAFGAGEGTNQLTIEKVNAGKKYIDSDTQVKYGIISKVWNDKRYTNDQSLLEAATAMLEKLKVPYISYAVEGLQIGALKDSKVGDTVRIIDDEEKTDVYSQIISIEKSDIIGRPDEASFVIANKAEDIATSIADLADRQRITETYAQGAVTLFTQSFSDNCSADFPAELRFYIPDNAVHINSVLLQGRASAFRGYTKATKGGGASSSTTSAGGGSYTSTGGGGGTQTTSGSTLSTVQSSSAVELYSQNAVHVDDGGYGNANHNHGIARGTWIQLADGGSVQWTPSGAHNHGAHGHTVTIPSHNHTVGLSDHSHGVSVPSHGHGFNLPDHTHDIEYGIYTGTTASILQIEADGVSVGNYTGSIYDLDLIDFLSKSEDGAITRGWHTIRINPDKLTRVEVDLVIKLFANSRGGGQY